MITKEQAVKAGESWGRVEFHYGECKKTVGPRGGITIKTEVWRSNGKCQTWKTRPDEFRLPIKWGLKSCDYLTHYNCKDFHLASECPLNE